MRVKQIISQAKAKAAVSGKLMSPHADQVLTTWPGAPDTYFEYLRLYIVHHVTSIYECFVKRNACYV